MTAIAKTPKKRILFFSPFSGFFLHAFGEALIAESLLGRKHEVTRLSCEGVLNERCYVMDLYGTGSSAEERNWACNRCRGIKNTILREVPIHEMSLESLLGPQDVQRVSDFMAGFTRSNFRSQLFDGIAVGEKSLFDTLLKFKKLDLEFTDTEWSHYFANVRGAALCVAAVGNLLKEKSKEKSEEKPYDALFVVNSQIGMNSVVCEVAKKAGMIVLNLHAGLSATDISRTMMVGQESNKRIRLEVKGEWNRFKNVPISKPEVDMVLKDQLSLIRSRFVLSYSADTQLGHKVSIRDRYGISRDQKILCVTMSSYDEMFSSELLGLTSFGTDLFNSQIEWIEFLLEYISKRKDLFLLIRVHPREFASRRDATVSYHAKELQQRFANMPDNAAVNWPKDGISIYDVAKHASVILNAWSSAGVDLSLLGLPVVSYSEKLIFYPSDLNYFGHTRSEYIQAIEQALADGLKFERVVKTFRWLALLNHKSVLQLGNDASAQFGQPRNTVTKIIRKVRRMFNPFYLEKADLVGRRPLAPFETDILERLVANEAVSKVNLVAPEDFVMPTFAEEEVRIRAALGEIYTALFGPGFSSVPGTLSQFMSEASQK